MSDWFTTLAAGNSLPVPAASALEEHGFVVLPGMVAVGSLEQLTTAYTDAVTAATGDDIRVGSTSTKVSDFIKACCQVIGGAFQLSSFHARTLLGFILMVDDFRPDNGMTRFVPGSHRWRLTPATSNWPRRSLQGAFIPQQGRAATDFAARMQPDTRARLSSLARSVLALPAV